MPHLAAVKKSNPHGFLAKFPVGLSVMFGTWTDFCLNCWAQYPTDYDGKEGPILILAPDHGPLDDPLAPVLPGVDWGVTGLNLFYQSTDPSTVNLFGAIYSAAGAPAPPCGRCFLGEEQLLLERFIARKRILVVNVWPWFRSGKSATDSASIHGSFSKVRTIPTWVNQLVQCLNPDRIGTLGGWAYDGNATALHTAIRTGVPSWFINLFLSGSRFDGLPASHPHIRQFYHPAALGNGWKKRPRWFNSTPGYGSSLTNEQAFVHFLR
ncbi:MAG: hypothetical protein ABMA26_13270 [Limisphaerales bacterium]